ncbi:hypothetical protein AB0H94_27495 [Streptomyces purpurascens]|uniref:hypothetical protein n=1 Tax=Streptomyces purpurascens TaxID=1924 RepID=UPI0033E348AA
MSGVAPTGPARNRLTDVLTNAPARPTIAVLTAMPRSVVSLSTRVAPVPFRALLMSVFKLDLSRARPCWTMAR